MKKDFIITQTDVFYKFNKDSQGRLINLALLAVTSDIQVVDINKYNEIEVKEIIEANKQQNVKFDTFYVEFQSLEYSKDNRELYDSLLYNEVDDFFKVDASYNHSFGKLSSLKEVVRLLKVWLKDYRGITFITNDDNSFMKKLISSDDEGNRHHGLRELTFIDLNSLYNFYKLSFNETCIENFNKNHVTPVGLRGSAYDKKQLIWKCYENYLVYKHISDTKL